MLVPTPTEVVTGSMLERTSAGVAVATWFGNPNRPLFGWWHLPAEQTIRALVVLAPAMARERLAADYSWRLLAASLTDAGFAVLRFDYSATGDSAGSAGDPDLVTAWLDDIDSALAAARSATDAPLVVVGHRLGATLTAGAIRRGANVSAGVSAAVLWDPVLRGKRYLRELRAQQRIAVPQKTATPSSSAWLDVPGDNLSLETAEQVSGLDLLAGGPLPVDRLLIVARPGSENDFARICERPDVRPVVGQPELLDLDPIMARPALESIARITEWLDETLGQEGHRIEQPGADEGIVCSSGSPQAAGLLVERAEYFAGDLFGILTEPAVPGSDRRTVVLLSAGLESHIGPGRLWVDLARQWAAMGFRVVRCDLPGLGDSPTRPGLTGQSVYEPSAIDDVVRLVRALSPDRPDAVTLVGMCSGAYNALEAAAKLHSQQLVLLAFGWWLIPAEFRRGHRTDRRRRGYHSALALLRPVLWSAPGRRLLMAHAGRFWLTGAKYRLAAPLRPFRRLVNGGTDVTLLLGESDTTHFTVQRKALNRLGRNRGFHYHFVPGLDHGLLSGDARREAGQAVLAAVGGRPD